MLTFWCETRLLDVILAGNTFALLDQHEHVGRRAKPGVDSEHFSVSVYLSVCLLFEQNTYCFPFDLQDCKRAPLGKNDDEKETKNKKTQNK